MFVELHPQYFAKGNGTTARQNKKGPNPKIEAF
jgi:hypothetical protein